MCLTKRLFSSYEVTFLMYIWLTKSDLHEIEFVYWIGLQEVGWGVVTNRLLLRMMMVMVMMMMMITFLMGHDFRQ